MIIDFSLILKSFPYVLSGLPYTLGISLLSFMVGNVFAIILAFMRMSQKPWLKYPARIYISFMRGVPMLVVLFILYFGLPYVGIQIPALLYAIIGFSTVSAAYMAEIFRSSISAVDKGQWKSAQSLGLPQKPIIHHIILPQALRIAVAPTCNVNIDMDKSSSLTAMITVPDIFQNAKIIGGREYDYMSMYILIALIYWTLSFTLELLQGYLEKRLATY